jgi:hypothetical protein
VHGINNNGQAVGQWFTAREKPRGFLLDIASNTFTDIDVPGAQRVAAWNINNAGAVAVSTDIGSFIWCEDDSACPAGGKSVGIPTHVTATPLPHFPCGRTCEIPAAAAKRAVQQGN